jgi:cytidine deaminase
VSVELSHLIERARAAMANAYAPYSKFHVGAAIEAEDGQVYLGCNVENASYGLTICAERMAVGAAAVAGARKFRRVVVATAVEPPVSPCGACRQLLLEFGGEMEVIGVGPQTQRRWTLRDLLPDAFSRESMKK